MLKYYHYWSQEHSSSKISSYWVPIFRLFLLKRSVSPVINQYELLLRSDFIHRNPQIPESLCTNLSWVCGLRPTEFPL